MSERVPGSRWRFSNSSREEGRGGSHKICPLAAQTESCRLSEGWLTTPASQMSHPQEGHGRERESHAWAETMLKPTALASRAQHHQASGEPKRFPDNVTLHIWGEGY